MASEVENIGVGMCMRRGMRTGVGMDTVTGAAMDMGMGMGMCTCMCIGVPLFVKGAAILSHTGTEDTGTEDEG